MWINPTNQQTFTTHSEIRSSIPNVSFPADMTEEDIAFVGILPVTLTPKPEFDNLTQKVAESAPLEIEGTWTQQWEIVPLTPEEQQAVILGIKQEIIDSTQLRLDTFAKTKNYDGILSLCTYATDTDPVFSAEGQRGVVLRTATWKKLYEILAEVESGTRPMPTGFAAIESELPTLDWNGVI